MRRMWAVVCASVLAGCLRFGQVEQGRAVAYDPAAGVVTVVRDSNYRELGKPRFDVLPAVAVRIPERAGEMGPAPEPGRLLAIDPAQRMLVCYDAGALRSIAYTPLEEHTGVAPGDARVQGLPRANREEIAAYDPAARVLVVFRATGELLKLPLDTFKAGDEVRYYYKQPGQALRMMNVTKNDLRKGHK